MSEAGKREAGGEKERRIETGKVKRSKRKDERREETEKSLKSTVVFFWSNFMGTRPVQN